MLDQEEIDGLQLQLEEFRQSDHKKLDVIHRLLDKYKEISKKFKDLESDLEVQTSARREMQMKARALEHKPFVLVLVDGDNYVFNDKLLKAGTEGGVEAAGLLRDAVKAELKSQDDGISTSYAGATEWRVMVRVYANFAGLSAALVRAGIQKSGNDLNKFAGGFTRGQPLFDFVDAGAEKEDADHKIRGYLSLLTPHKKVDSHITLLKATTCHKKFLALGYRAVEFPTVFKSVPLPEGSNTSTNQTAQGSHTHNGTIRSPVPGNFLLEGPRNAFGRVVYLNQHDQRIDPPLLGITEHERTRFRQRTNNQHLCNEYHLLGKCPALPGRACLFDHKYVDPGLLLVLKERLRLQRCKKGSACRSHDCYYGHACRGPGCTGGKGCSFSSLLHNLDADVVREISTGA
ncbi:hypothetical protein MMC26_004696 [Xylographa opegraphella]|nr:hypothetical protein [Xylographa opegraphella]